MSASNSSITVGGCQLLLNKSERDITIQVKVLRLFRDNRWPGVLCDGKEWMKCIFDPEGQNVIDIDLMVYDIIKIKEFGLRKTAGYKFVHIKTFDVVAKAADDCSFNSSQAIGSFTPQPSKKADEYETKDVCIYYFKSTFYFQYICDLTIIDKITIKTQ